jgi:hypothetical protein
MQARVPRILLQALQGALNLLQLGQLVRPPTPQLLESLSRALREAQRVGPGALVLVLAVAILDEAAQVHGFPSLGFRQAFADLRCEIRATPHDHLPLWDGHDWDEQKHAVDVALHSVSPPRLRACLAEAHPAAAVNPRFGNSLEVLTFVWGGWGCHRNYLPDGYDPYQLSGEYLYNILSGILGNTHLVSVP